MLPLSLRSMKKAFVQLHIAVFLAGFTAILGKLILLNEGLLVWYRLFLTVIVLGTIMLYKKQLIKIHVKDCFKIAGVGLVIAIHWVAFYGSVKYANVSVALVCFSATGFFTAVFNFLNLTVDPLCIRFVNETLVHSLDQPTRHQQDVIKQLKDRESPFKSWSITQQETFLAICSDSMTELGYPLP